MLYYTELPSPLGTLLLESDGTALTGLWMDREPPEKGIRQTCPVLAKTEVWLDAYFRGQPTEIDFPIAPKGTPFQLAVWECLLAIPFGETRTYGSIAREMAQKLGRETMSAQAVGGAVGRNPISILIPCHRCLGAKGQLTGYAWGLERKEWLLEHEGILVKSEEVRCAFGTVLNHRRSRYHTSSLFTITSSLWVYLLHQ